MTKVLPKMAPSCASPTVATRLGDAFAVHASRCALEIGDVRLTYAQLWTKASDTARQLAPALANGGAIGFLPQRSVETYTAVLAAIMLRRPYVSLNMKFPLSRQLQIARASDCRVIVGDAATAARRAEMLDGLGWVADRPPVASAPAAVLSDDPAYYMFTSGTTGTPKGILVSGANMLSYLDAIRTVVPIAPGTAARTFST